MLYLLGCPENPDSVLRFELFREAMPDFKNNIGYDFSPFISYLTST